jgi:hypothetical protein
MTIGTVAVAFIVFAAWLISGWCGPSTVQIVSDLTSLMAGGFPVTSAALATSSSRGRQRWAWALLTVGAAPFPSAADAGYLLFPVATCLALILLPIGKAGQSQTRLVLDGVIVAGSLFVILWAIGLDQVFSGATESRLAFAVSVAYPVTDLVLVTVALLILTRAREGQRGDGHGVHRGDRPHGLIGQRLRHLECQRHLRQWQPARHRLGGGTVTTRCCSDRRVSSQFLEY